MEPKVKNDEKKVTRTVYGHLIGSQAGNIDEFLLRAKTAKTAKEIAEEMKLSVPRIKSHLRHLIGAKGLIFKIEEDKYLLVGASEKK